MTPVRRLCRSASAPTALAAVGLGIAVLALASCASDSGRAGATAPGNEAPGSSTVPTNPLPAGSKPVATSSLAPHGLVPPGMEGRQMPSIAPETMLVFITFDGGPADGRTQWLPMSRIRDVIEPDGFPGARYVTTFEVVQTSNSEEAQQFVPARD
ncbi:hypothetical protein OG216_34950 [Streptomycetaceae bacterium NBC_01309]